MLEYRLRWQASSQLHFAPCLCLDIRQSRYVRTVVDTQLRHLCAGEKVSPYLATGRQNPLRRLFQDDFDIRDRSRHILYQKHCQLELLHRMARSIRSSINLFAPARLALETFSHQDPYHELRSQLIFENLIDHKSKMFLETQFVRLAFEEFAHTQREKC